MQSGSLSLPMSRSDHSVQTSVIWQLFGMTDPKQNFSQPAPLHSIFVHCINHLPSLLSLLSNQHIASLQVFCTRKLHPEPETKLKETLSNHVTTACGTNLDSWQALNANGTRGGLLTCWNSNQTTGILFYRGTYSLSTVHGPLLPTPSNKDWLITNVYGPNDCNLRPKFFSELTSIRQLWHGPWIIIGDFNATRFTEERKGLGGDAPVSDELNLFIDNNRLFEIKQKHLQFTWSNHRSTPSLAKLDRCLVSADWLESNPLAMLMPLSKTTSDHFPLLLEFNRRPPDFDEVVRAYWLTAPTATNASANLLQLILRKEKILWRQRSRINWLKHGDKNTKYFHAYASNRRRKNMICNNAASLEQPFTEEEIRQAVFNLLKGKAPGPDGFPAEFFQRFWDLLKPDLLRLSDAFDNHKADISRHNFTLVSLIPKTQNCRRVRDYCPISLMNGMLKIITKMLSSRLSKVISTLITDAQSAFIKNRHIIDSYLSVAEIIAASTRSKTGGLALKLDFEKAFDTVSWKFILAILKARGFGEHWCKWIEHILSSNKHT
ncbi:uncharacterized protein [Elaeis guineensis]|uniref:uncharacterized protein n=1 Tax=Elaeis guineensis var. tenera TaxID=51953 RepID=UPI003C6CF368